MEVAADSLRQAAESVTNIREEIKLHIKECEDFGLTQEDMEAYEESQGP